MFDVLSGPGRKNKEGDGGGKYVVGCEGSG